MRDFRVLKILDVFRPLFEQFQVDYPILRNILSVKLLMDGRRIPTIFDNKQEKQSNMYIKSLWVYFLYGFILLFFVFGTGHMMQMSIIFGVALFVLMTALIADFSAVMLDVRDKTIIGTKPVDKRTIGVAKFIHILIYLILITGAFTIIPVIFMIFVQGILFMVLFIILLILFMLFIMALTSLIYFYVLKWFSGEQLKSMITSIQILFAVGIIIGYQIIIRGYGFIDIHDSYTFLWWHALLPPMWFAAPFELVMNHNNSIAVIVLSLMSIMIPLVTIFAYFRLIPVFEANLQKMLETTRIGKKRGFFLENLWTRLLCRTEAARAYFQFVFRIVDRESEFKLKVYPSLGIGLVFPFVFIFSEAGVRTFEEITDSYLFLCIYLMHIFIGFVIYIFQFSDSYKGAWIFTMSDGPISSQLYAAVLKVFLVKLYVPMFIFVGVVYYFLFHQFHLIDLGIVLVSAITQALFSYKLVVKGGFPFSQPFEKLTEKGDTATAFLLMLLTVPFVILHFTFALVPFGLYVYFILLIVAAVFLWRQTFLAFR